MWLRNFCFILKLVIWNNAEYTFAPVHWTISAPFMSHILWASVPLHLLLSLPWDAHFLHCFPLNYLQVVLSERAQAEAESS